MVYEVASALAKLQRGDGCLTDMNMYSPVNREGCIAGPVWTVKVHIFFVDN